MNRQTWLGVAVLLLATTTSTAQMDPDQLNYTYVDYGHVELDFDQGDGDGLWVAGSLALTDFAHVFAGYQTGDINSDAFNDDDPDYMSYSAGIGTNLQIQGLTDVVARASYVYAEIEDLDHIGLGLYGGLRSRVAPGFEFDAGVNYTTLDDFGDNTSFSADARWYFYKQFALGAGVEVGDDVTAWTIGLRKEIPFN